MKTCKLLSIHFMIFMVLGLLSCKTYYIPVDSFKEQFKGIDSTKLRIVNTRGPVGDIVEYLANLIGQ